MHRRRLPAAGDRGSRLQRRRRRPEDLQRRRHPLEASADGGADGAARHRRRRSRALRRGGDRGARSSGAGHEIVRVASIYLPNGNPAGHATSSPTSSPGWIGCAPMRRSCSKLEEVLVLGGDYNVAPTDADVYDPEGWRDDALCRPELRGAASRAPQSRLHRCDPRAAQPSPISTRFWDYQAGRWQRDEGLRIDHLLLSPQAADRLSAVRHRSRSARQGQAVGSHAGVVRAGGLAVAARPGDQPHAALERDVGPQPVEHHRKPVAEADQEVDVGGAPEQPGADSR